MVIQTEKKQENTRKSLKYLRDKYREKVKGIFQNFEVPGGSVTFVYREFKEDPVEKYTLVDGHTYELPLGVARHLNKHCNYPVHAHKLDENHNPIIVVGKKVSRYGFKSLEFMDPEDLLSVDENNECV